MEIPGSLICLLWNLYAGQETTIRTRHGPDWFQTEKGYHQCCMLSPSYLIYMQSTACKIPGWMKQKLESILLGEISVTSDTHMAYPHGRKQREIKEPLGEGKKGERKADLKVHIQKMNIMSSSSITLWQIDGEIMETVTDLISWAPKSLWLVTAGIKLKYACFLKEKLWPT